MLSCRESCHIRWARLDRCFHPLREQIDQSETPTHDAVVAKPITNTNPSMATAKRHYFHWVSHCIHTSAKPLWDFFPKDAKLERITRYSVAIVLWSLDADSITSVHIGRRVCHNTDGEKETLLPLFRQRTRQLNLLPRREKTCFLLKRCAEKENLWWCSQFFILKHSQSLKLVVFLLWLLTYWAKALWAKHNVRLCC